MPSEPQRQPLPFEPKRDRQSAPKADKTQPRSPTAAGSAKSAPKKSQSTRATQSAATSTQIPEVVSRRMIRRMAFFSGIPTMMGIMSFFTSYFVVRLGLLELPNVAVVLVSMGCFGLGVVGLSYGVLSASWDEETPGHLLGWSEFQTNLGRMTDAWRGSGDLRS